LCFSIDGAERDAGAASDFIERLEVLIEQFPHRPGKRLIGVPSLRELLSGAPFATIAKTHLSHPGSPVRAAFRQKQLEQLDVELASRPHDRR
jgi:hypothetical protein